jgi:hypothetical protein
VALQVVGELELRGVLGHRPVGDPRVVGEHVDTAQLPLGLLHHRALLQPVGDVERPHPQAGSCVDAQLGEAGQRASAR